MKVLTPFQVRVLESHVVHVKALGGSTTLIAIDELEELLRVYCQEQKKILRRDSQ